MAARNSCPSISRTPTSGHAEPHEGPTFLLLLQAELCGLVDVLACANFGPVLFVSLSYYTMRLLPIQEPIYGDDYRFQVLPAGVNPLENWVRLYLTCLPCLPFPCHFPMRLAPPRQVVGGTVMPAARPLMPVA